MSRLRFRTLTTRDKTIVSTRGDIDLSTASEFESYLLALVNQGQSQLVVNFSHTNYLDSSGLAALVRVHKALNTCNGQITIVGCQPSVSRLFGIVGFHHLFPIEDADTLHHREHSNSTLASAIC
jgi:anti-sigma B factor antagonist